MMKKRRLIAVIIFVVVLFLGTSLNVSAENYVATSAPDEVKLEHLNSLGDPAFSTAEHNAMFGNAYMFNNSLYAANAGSVNSGYSLGQASCVYGMVYDLHTEASYADGCKPTACNWEAGDKLFVIDSMGAPYYEAKNTSRYSLTKRDGKVDYGITYIIVNAFDYLKKNNIEERKTYNRNVELSWFTQVAIWKYQDINNFSKVSMNSNELYEAGYNTTQDFFNDVNNTRYKLVYSDRAITLWNLADGLVAEAKKVSSASNLTLNYDGNYTIEENTKKVKTTLISSSTSGSISSFALDLSKAPSGTKVYNESNAEITSLSNIPSNTKFYLEIPVENIENFTYDFNVTASATIGNYKGHRYKKSENTEQSAAAIDTTYVLVTAEPEQMQSTIEMKATHVEDSASSIPKMMYIIGLLILLCGVGIIYGNMKPRHQEV